MNQSISVYTDDEVEFVWLMAINKIPSSFMVETGYIYMYM